MFVYFVCFSTMIYSILNCIWQEVEILESLSDSAQHRQQERAWKYNHQLFNWSFSHATPYICKLTQSPRKLYLQSPSLKPFKWKKSVKLFQKKIIFSVFKSNLFYCVTPFVFLPTYKTRTMSILVIIENHGLEKITLSFSLVVW